MEMSSKDQKQPRWVVEHLVSIDQDQEDDQEGDLVDDQEEAQDEDMEVDDDQEEVNSDDSAQESITLDRIVLDQDDESVEIHDDLNRNDTNRRDKKEQGVLIQEDRLVEVDQIVVVPTEVKDHEEDTTTMDDLDLDEDNYGSRTLFHNNVVSLLSGEKHNH